MVLLCERDAELGFYTDFAGGPFESGRRGSGTAGPALPPRQTGPNRL